MKLTTCGLVAVFLVACSSAPPAPEAPVFKTKAGKACVKQCEAEHSKCEADCDLIQGVRGGPARQRSNCNAACVRATQACYAQCQADIPATPPSQ